MACLGASLQNSGRDAPSSLVSRRNLYSTSKFSIARSLSDLDDFEQNVLEFSHNPPSDAGVYWNIRQSGGWIWANSKTIVAGSGKSDRLLEICFSDPGVPRRLSGGLEGERREEVSLSLQEPACRRHQLGATSIQLGAALSARLSEEPCAERRMLGSAREASSDGCPYRNLLRNARQCRATIILAA
ncbi:MAG: hypothetical protein ACI9NC_001091 [Verrucomicrobiales bacterium]|jgi:hypothetical protein